MIEFFEYFKQTVKKIYLKYKYWNGIKFEYYKKSKKYLFRED